MRLRTNTILLLSCGTRSAFSAYHLDGNPNNMNPNDRLSPTNAASALTAAVPFGIFTRFPILPQGQRVAGPVEPEGTL